MKKISILFLVGAILLSLASCGSALHKVDIKDLKDSAGDFVYKGIPWGSGMEEVADSLGIALTNPMLSTDSEGLEGATYNQRDSAQIVLAGKTYKGDASIKFKEEQLLGISFDFYVPVGESENAYDALVAEITKAYGNPDSVNVRSHIWWHDDDMDVMRTAAGAGKGHSSKDDSMDIVSVILSIGKL